MRNTLSVTDLLVICWLTILSLLLNPRRLPPLVSAAPMPPILRYARLLHRTSRHRQDRLALTVQPPLITTLPKVKSP